MNHARYLALCANIEPEPYGRKDFCFVNASQGNQQAEKEVNMPGSKANKPFQPLYTFQFPPEMH